MDVDVVAARWKLDLVLSDELAELAAEMLADGYESPSLIELASTPVSDLTREGPRLLERALVELERALPSVEQAVLTLARVYAEAIVTAEIAPYHGASAIWGLSNKLHDVPDDLLLFVGLASEWEDNPACRAEYEDDIRAAARDFVVRTPPR